MNDSEESIEVVICLEFDRDEILKKFEELVKKREEEFKKLEGRFNYDFKYGD